MRPIVSIKGCEFECGHCKKIVAFNFFGLAHTACPETKFGLRRKLLRMLSWRFLGPVYTVLKNHEHTGISLVCLKQMAACTLVRRYVGRTDFWFKINYRRAFALPVLRKYRPGLSERPLHDFLLATKRLFARRKPTNPINFLLYLGLNLISCVNQLRQLALCKRRAEGSSFWNLLILMRSFCPEFKYCLDEMLCFLWYCNFFPHSEI